MLGNRKGDNNQLYALAEALGIPFEAKQLAYNQLRRLRFLRGPRLVSLTPAARATIVPPRPDLVIGAGYGSIPVARYIRARNGGRTRIVQLGNPRTAIDDLDLVITTPQYGRAPAPNVLALPFPVGNPAKTLSPTIDEAQWLQSWPAPRRLIAVGGPTRNWSIDRRTLRHAIAVAERQAQADGGSVIVALSPRTPAAVTAWLRRSLAGRPIALVEDFPRFGVLLGASDQFSVTADSVSMLSEAILTARPVALIPIRLTPRGVISYGLSSLRLKPRTRIDLPKFWRLLEREGLVGTPERPVATTTPETIATAVAAIRGLFDRPPAGP